MLAAALACGERRRPAPPPVVEIALDLPGASAASLERDAVEPVERAVAGLPGVGSIGARITEGRATVSVELTPADDRDAVHEVRDAIAAILPQLPRGVSPVVARVAAPPALWLAIAGALPRDQLSDLAADHVRPALERLPGVAAIDVVGAVRHVVVIRPDLARLAATGLTLTELAAELRARTDARPARRLEPGRPTIRVDGAIPSVEALARLPIAVRDGANVRVSDVARLEDTVEPIARAGEPTARAGEPTARAGEPTARAGEPISGPLALGVRVQRGAELAAVTAAVRGELARLRAALPAGVTITDAAPPPGHAITPVPLTVTLRGGDPAQLVRIADDLTRALRAAGATAIERDPPDPAPELTVVPARDRAAALAVDLPELAATLRLIVAGDPLGDLELDGRRRAVELRLTPEAADPTAALPAGLAHVQIRSARAGLVELSELVTVTTTRAPAIARRDRQRATTLAIQAPATALPALRARVSALALPTGYTARTSP